MIGGFLTDDWDERVDAVSRGVLAMTVACARCHDHKFDPIPTKDYYGLVGVFASTMRVERPLFDVDPRGRDALPVDPETGCSTCIIRPIC